MQELFHVVVPPPPPDVGNYTEVRPAGASGSQVTSEQPQDRMAEMQEYDGCQIEAADD